MKFSIFNPLIRFFVFVGKKKVLHSAENPPRFLPC